VRESLQIVFCKKSPIIRGKEPFYIHMLVLAASECSPVRENVCVCVCVCVYVCARVCERESEREREREKKRRRVRSIRVRARVRARRARVPRARDMYVSA